MGRFSPSRNGVLLGRHKPFFFSCFTAIVVFFSPTQGPKVLAWENHSLLLVQLINQESGILFIMWEEKLTKGAEAFGKVPKYPLYPW